ncbi:MAG: Ig-like domain-containing protein [Acutalibacteraceae bacterium]
MSIATIKAVIDGQTYPLTLSEDGYYVLAGTAPALSSANEPGGYYGVQIIATDEAGNETTINQEDGTWGEQLRLVAYESVKPTATITYPSSDSRINTCTPTITAQLRDNDSGVDPATLDLRINGGSKITQGAPGLTLTPVEGGYDLSYAVPTALDEGQTTISVGVSDMDGNAADPSSITCTIAVTAPTSLSSPAEGLVTNQAAVQITGITSDDQLTSVTLTVTVNGHDQGPVTVDGQTGAFAVSANPSHMQEGSNVITVKVVDATGLEAEITRNVTLDTIPPRIIEVIGVTDRVHVGSPFTIRVKVED